MSPHARRLKRDEAVVSVSHLAPPAADDSIEEPRSSTDTLRSFDISATIPSIALPMDPEASPWDDVPSNSASQAKPPTAEATTAEASDSAQSTIPEPSPASSAPATRAPTSRAPRGAKKVILPSARLEPVEGSSDPVGPLNVNQSSQIPDQPPSPPLKEQHPRTRNAKTSHSSPTHIRTDTQSRDAPDEDDASISSERIPRHRNAPQSTNTENTRRQTQPSVSIEQAARPTFHITVGDPHKVGDPISSHIVYQVRTKTTSKAYKQPDFSVSRRYRDFLWLYNTLHNNNPGIVAPPPPEKQAVGRFESNFVESRRAALERMLNKITAHHILQHDADLKIFLESEAFNMDVKHREHKEIGLGESKGMLSTFGLGSTSTGKFIEHDDWFHDRRLYLDALENQLKALLKSMDMVVGQRKALSEAAGELSASLESLANVEVSISLSTPLAGLADIQLRIRDLYERQAQQDILTLGITIDEYIRIIGSVRTAFSQRQKSFHSWHNAESELQKRRTLQEKTLRSGKTQQDRLNQLQADVSDGERRCHQARLLFDDMGRLMRSELERFEREKVEDFKSGVETFLEGAIEAQKELIECWETFLMQLDADEDGEPFFKPQQVGPPSAAPGKEKILNSEEGKRQEETRPISQANPESTEHAEIEEGQVDTEPTAPEI